MKAHGCDASYVLSEVLPTSLERELIGRNCPHDSSNLWKSKEAEHSPLTGASQSELGMHEISARHKPRVENAVSFQVTVFFFSCVLDNLHLFELKPEIVQFCLSFELSISALLQNSITLSLSSLQSGKSSMHGVWCGHKLPQLCAQHAGTS